MNTFSNDEEILKIRLTNEEIVKPIPEKMPLHNPNYAIRLCVDKPEYALKIFVPIEIMKQILDYSKKDTTRELGGVLIGDYCLDNKIKSIKISDFIEARNTQGDNSHIRFNHETWNAIEQEKKTKKIPEGKQMVGWFHTHPGWGIFLSEDDLFIHQNFFNLPWQVAMVVDPLQKEQGFFIWENDKIIKSRDFYLYTIKERESELISFVHSLSQSRKLDR
ncbi:MAG: Mov34/MPN/PAD-1 family protein [bacterium]